MSSANATVDLTKLDIFNNFKYDKNPLYEYNLRNIKYLPDDPTSQIPSSLIEFFNAMIVRKDTNYYGMSRSMLNYPMNHTDVLQTYRNELNDYLKLYNDWTSALKKYPKSGWSQLYYDYEYLVYHFTIPEIIRLNKIINLQISIPDDVPKEINYSNYIIVFIGMFICLIIIWLNSKNYYV